MHTCYLFTDNFENDSCLSICLDANGEVSDDLEIRSINEIQQLQTNAKTFVVVSSELTAIHNLELPALSANKARSVIGYMLEESLAEPVLSSHFSFDKKHYLHGNYLVAVIDKNIILGLQQRLASLNIDYDVITCDWFALNVGESCVISNRFVVNDVNFKGSLSLDLFEHYLVSQTDFSHILMFNDSPALQQAEKFSKINHDTYAWLAKRLYTNQPINFCQAEFAHKTNQDNLKKYYKFAGYLGGMCLIGLLISKIVLLITLGHNIQTYDKKIATLYRKFFPDAKQVISPKFRITQVLNKNLAGHDAKFWQLLSKFTNSVQVYLLDIPKDQQDSRAYVQVKNINLQNDKLIISLICSDFEVLEKVENNLKAQQTKVQKSGVTSKGEKVIATLELA